MPPLRSKLSYSNVIASLALFVALGGAAVAAGLPNNSIGAAKLKNGAVTTKKLRKEAVTGHKLAPGAVSGSKLTNGAVTGAKLAGGAVGTAALGNGVVTNSKLANNSVTNSKIDNGVVGTNKLGTEVVTSSKLQKEGVTTDRLKNGSVTSAKLSDEIGPLLGTLRSGQTLRGVVYASGSDESGGGKTIASTAVSFQFPLNDSPALSIVDPNSATTGACPGITGGAGQTPQATAGNLCVYITGKQNALTPTFPTSSSNRLGFAIQTKSGGAEGEFWVVGQWAVTAP